MVPPLSEVQLREISPLALAYLGDAVYELFVRCRFLLPPKRIRAYHHQVVSHVRAEQQAAHLQVLQPYLTAAEHDVLRRGRNAAPNRKSRGSAIAYQQATSLEALVGYLYLTDPPRLMELLGHLSLITITEATEASESTP
ncbi:MAG: ribonuclease III [Leptolyngbyaceae cyanobacterium T60_A2020_046]|nr:ribonuclease III [Leptolyngbyaceae cyanobacterium T60_A2020_046]